ncbi:MAG: 5,10-methylenetetrahydromethanopterin reductase [Candidatus Lokiarchaeota archaeon]|nr:5,10-methylenetetrahydromethanopterin reductase [Candidatus Lokiarchaeota archaeon]
MRFGIEFAPFMSTLDIAYYSRIAEELGFDNIWITDHYNNRNVYVALTHVALYTNKITIGAGVTNPYHINPAVIASSIATIDEISGGRTVLGIGAGDKTTLADLGIERKNVLSAMRESISIIRKLWAGKKIHHEGEVFEMPNAKLGFKVANILPIYLAAQGPEMTQLSAEIAEGVLINGSHPQDFVFAEKMLKKGSKKSQRCITPPNFDLAAYTVFSIDKNREKALDAAKIPVAYVVAGSIEKVLNRNNIDLEVSEKISQAMKKGDLKEAKSLITKDMLDLFAVIGDTEECIDKIEALINAGVTQIVVGTPIGPDIIKSIKTIGKKIIPLFDKEE